MFLSNKIIMIAGKIEVARYYQDLMYIEFKNPYCRLHFSEGSEYLVDISLTRLLANIPDKTFFRCNRTEVINLYYYGGYNKELNEIMLEDNSKFKLSSRNIAVFKKKIEYLWKFWPPCSDCSDCDEQNCSDYLFPGIDSEKVKKLLKSKKTIELWTR